MEFSISALLHLIPEMALILGAIVILISGLIFHSNQTLIKWINISIYSINLFLSLAGGDLDITLFNNQIYLGETEYSARILIALAGWLLAISFHSYQFKKQQPEYFLMLIGLQLGAQVTIMANHAITLMLAIEMMSFSAYTLAGFSFNKESSEAGTKFFLFGSTATALTAFGFSWIYGATGQLTWQSVGSIFSTTNEIEPIAVIGAILIISAVTFKLAAAPLHWWVPDVYQVAPYPVIAAFSSIPKIAAIIILVRLGMDLPENNSGEFWLMTLGVLASLTLLAGNFPALWQKDARRLMGYSSIGQAGFLMLGLCVLPNQMQSIVLFYALVMMIGVILVIYCLNWFSREFNTKVIPDFSGLGKGAFIPAAGLTIGLLSLTGLPPFAGFQAKLLLFTGLASGIEQSPSLMIFLLIFGIMNTVVA